MTRNLLLIIMFFFSVSAFAQNRTVKGTIKDKNGEPLIGASVIVVGSNPIIGVAADIDGSFSIDLPNGLNSVEVSYINYKNTTINVQNKSEINIILQEDDSFLSEAIVVGYGKQKRLAITGAVSSVSGKDIVKRNATNLSSAIQGMMPGVSVVQISGQPGQDGGSIQVRGRGSDLSGTSPLILIDGVEEDMNGLDMNMVESISVLKDASASIYGSRATNGVVLITTKRGDKGAVKVNYSGYASLSVPTDMPKPVDGADYMMYFNMAKIHDKESPTYEQSRIEEYRKYGADQWINFDTDWIGAIMKESALMHKHALSLSGGSDKFSYSAGGSYQYQDGIINNNDFKRVTFRLNTDTKLNSWAKLGLDANARYNVELTPSIATPSELIGQALTLSPVLPGINRDGTYGPGNSGYNPIAILEAGGTQKYHVSDNSVRASLILTPLKGLEVSSLFKIGLQEDWSDAHQNIINMYTQGNNTHSYPNGIPENGKTTTMRKRLVSYQYNLQSSYEASIKGHKFKLLGGMQVEYQNSVTLFGSGQGFDNPDYTDVSKGATTSLSENYHELALVGYYGRFNYSYKDRYLLEFTGRYDGSSRFIHNRWGFFPGGSAGWRISEENFFSGIKSIVNELKYRVSYSHMGNQALSVGSNSVYPYSTKMYIGNYEGYYFGNETFYKGALLKQHPNPKISWETSIQFNTGIDMAFFKNRLNASFDIFRRDVADLITFLKAPVYTGYSDPYFNFGRMRNQGFEIQIIWKDRIGDLGYSITGNFSDARTTWVKVYNEIEEGFSPKKPGVLFNQISGYLTDGYYQSKEDVENSATVWGDKVNTNPGDIKFKDINNDGTINNADIVILGDGSPRYEYSLNLSADWKGFDLTVFLQGVGKKEKNYNGSGVRPLTEGRSMYQYQTDFWTEDNRNAKFPALTLKKTNNGYASSMWVKSAAYLRLKNVVLGYTLPKGISQKLKINRLRTYISAQNLFTFSKGFPGFDPEGGNSYNSTFYPIMKMYSVGLDISF